MSIVLGAVYLAGWIVTTALLLRRIPLGEGQNRGHRAAMGMVSVLCAIALAAVWPLSGWLLPLIRAAMESPEEG